MAKVMLQRIPSPMAVIGCLVLVLCWLAFIGSLRQAPGQREIAVAILFLTSACFIPALFLGVSRVSPGFIYCLATFLQIGLGSLAWLGAPEFAPPGLGQQAIAAGMRLLAVGIVAFWIGYGLVRPPRDIAPEEPQQVVPPWVLLGLFAIGVMATVILAATGRFGYRAIFTGPGDISWWQQWVQTATGLTGIAVILAGLHAFGNGSRAHRRALVLMVIASLGIGFIAGYKSAVLTPLATTLFIYYYFRRRLPWKTLVVAFLLVLLLVPANLAYRGTIVAGSRSATTVFDSVLGLSLSERITITSDWLAERFRIIDSIAQIQRLTPTPYPFLGAEKFAEIPAITLIPRVVWAGKPTENQAITFGRTYFGAPADSVNSFAITNVGDLYIHAGPVGVVLGMLVWGAVGGVLFRWLRLRMSSGAFLVYVVMLFRMVQVEVTFLSLISEGFRAVLLAWVVARLLYGPTSATNRSTRPVAAGSGLVTTPAS
jgi:hypothetical protein